MGKLDRTALLRKGELLLKEWAPALAPEAALAQLQALAGRDAAADIAIAARLGAIADPAHVEALRALEQHSSDKNVHKEVRRALYRLEQKGLAIPAEPLPSIAKPTVTQSLEGYVSPIDGHGDRLVWLVKSRAGGVAHLNAVLNDPEGLREVETYETTRKHIRSARDSLRERNQIDMVEADWHYCDFLIDRATAWAKQRNLRMVGDYGHLRAILIGAPVQPSPPLIYRYLQADAIRSRPELLNDSASVLEQDEFRTWFLERATVAPYIEEVKQVRNSPIVLAEAQQQERVRLIGEKAVEQLFGGEGQASWVRRLEEMAYIFYALKRPHIAERTLAAALALSDSKHGGKGIPFFETLAGAGMMLWLRTEEKHEAEESRGQLVLTPQQALRESQRK